MLAPSFPRVFPAKRGLGPGAATRREDALCTPVPGQPRLISPAARALAAVGKATRVWRFCCQTLTVDVADTASFKRPRIADALAGRA